MTDVGFMQYGYGGLLAIVLIAIGRGAVVIYRDVVKPMTARHMEFTQAIQQNTATTADSTAELVTANKLQVDLLNEIKQTQANYTCKFVSNCNNYHSPADGRP